MAHALPIAKLAGLFIKTLSKPLSKRIKHDFSRNATTQEILVGIGQMLHGVSTRLTVWGAGYKITTIKPLEREEALKRGAEFLGESVVFVTAVGVTTWEYAKTKAKEKIKEDLKHQALQQDSEELQQKLRALDVRLQALEKVVKANTQSRLNFGERYIEPEEVKIDISTPVLRKELAQPADKTESSVSSTVPEQSDSSRNTNDQEGTSRKDNNGKTWWGRLNFGEKYIEPEEVKIDNSTPVLRKELAQPTDKTESSVSSTVLEQSDSSRNTNEQEGISRKDNNGNTWWGWITTPFQRGDKKS